MKKILMIEDDTGLHQVYRDALSDEQITIVGATTGKEGLEKIKTEKPDLIILDIMLPGGLNGFDVAEQMRKDPQTAYIPLLILTNLDSEKQSAMAVGAADYLVKSNTSIEDVIKKIRQLLGIV
jgi:CheY-like chemotaxis protein